MIVLDEYGERWLVTKDDPPWKIIRTLIRMGYPEDYIVLPQSVTLFGEGRCEQPFERQLTMEQQLRLWDTSKALDILAGEATNQG